MATSTFPPKSIPEVFRTIFDFPATGMSKALAESILAMDFPESYLSQIDDLNEKANEGTLSKEEEEALDTFGQASDLLAYWQSKARQYMQQSG